jgi:hypothetical protein
MGQPVKFYTDEHVARAVVNGLRQRGADVLTVPEAEADPSGFGSGGHERPRRVLVEQSSRAEWDALWAEVRAALDEAKRPAPAPGG